MSYTLLIDIGNQRIKWCWLELGVEPSVSKLRWMIEQSMEDEDLTEEQDVAGLFEQYFGGELAPDRVLVSCVSKLQIVQALSDFCQLMWDIDPEMVKTPLLNEDLKNLYQNPSQLGVDRWLAALAAHRTIETKDGEALVIVDAGTAITVDLVHQNAFQGGAILPGLAILIMGLGRDTKSIEIDFDELAQLVAEDDFGVGFRDAVVATDSANAVTAGVMASALGGVSYCIARITEGLKSGVKVVVTGGDAALLGPALNCQVRIEANLVITGLAFMALDSTQ